MRVTEEWYQTTLFKVRRKVKVPAKKIALGPEDYLAEQLSVREIPFVRQFRFNPARKVRADFWITGTRLLVEVDGGTWLKDGAHNSGKGYAYDRQRDIEALLLGYITVRVVPRQVNSYEALQYIQQLIPMYTRALARA